MKKRILLGVSLGVFLFTASFSIQNSNAKGGSGVEINCTGEGSCVCAEYQGVTYYGCPKVKVIAS